jgi:hypothetical protein
MADWTGIRLHRQRGFYRDSLRSYRVRIDGSVVGEIDRGETQDFFLPPGEHRLRLSLDGLWRSPEVTLIVREGELAEFTCRPGPLLLVLYALLVPNRYIRISGPVVTSLT